MVDLLSKKMRSKVMSSIKSKGTTIEEKFSNALRNNGIKGYTSNPRMLSHPDFVFKEKKIAIFCDGDFWHGKEYNKLQARLSKNYWKYKIRENVKRDKKYNKILKKEGWVVLRFWESDINNNIIKCIKKVQLTIEKCSNFTQAKDKAPVP